ncbi:hypothetical protein AW736_14630 [Termitidicoccus mucosus]|uniref:Exostosin GT47 domain-containing protein n=2 Tax=Termitidicoccus mucosus TaxID=1184151 RepID=A0A178IJA4_9BACT|nr:hypothetical protein AW736_14630 [Opitutaceae bacterium TSB47]
MRPRLIAAQPARIQAKPMRVAIISLSEKGRQDGPALRNLHAVSTPRTHELVDNPDDAELVIFTDLAPDAHYRSLRAHPLPRRRPADCFTVYHWHEPYGLLPGLYTETPRLRIGSRRHRAGLYWPERHTNPLVSTHLPLPEKDRPWLFSFLGRDSHPVRARVFSLPPGHGGKRALIEDTGRYDHWKTTGEARDAALQNYVDSARDSYFGLCPRGLRKPSIRLFEMMQLGVCPVVLADGYVFPTGPRWEDFCLIIKERDAGRLWEILTGREAEAIERGRLAREEWERWFAVERQFNYIVGQLAAIRARPRAWPEGWLRGARMQARIWTTDTLARLDRLRARL